MLTATEVTPQPETRQVSDLTVEDLNAEIQRREAEARLALKGKVIIAKGVAFIHDGKYSGLLQDWQRVASEAEEQALRTIPEFNTALKLARGEA